MEIARISRELAQWGSHMSTNSSAMDVLLRPSSINPDVTFERFQRIDR
jgi:hypothetical protein